MPYTTNMRALGKELKAAREKAGMTQEQAAQAIGATQLTISNWELGKKTPGLKMFITLLNAYDATFDDIAH